MTKDLEKQFLDIFDETGSPEAVIKAKREIAANPELAASFEKYKNVVALESELAKIEAAPSPNFVLNVMTEVNKQNQGFFRRLVMEMLRSERLILATAGGLAMIVMAIRLTNTSSIPLISKQLSPTQLYAPVIADMKKSEEKAAATSLGSSGMGENLSASAAPIEKRKHKNPSLDLLNKPQSASTMNLNEADMLQAPAGKASGGVAGAVIVGNSKYTVTKNGQLQPEAESSITQRLDYDTAKKSVQGVVDQPRIEERVQQIRKAKRDLFSRSGSHIDESKFADNALRYVAPVPMQSTDSESYQQFADNTRILVTQNPVSTFSLDVDTGSYANVRRFIMSGQRPPRDAVRTEELINYFTYDYPVQRDKPFTVSYEIAPSPFDQQRFLLKLGVKAKDIDGRDQPWNLVFLVDVSGSMDEANKLPLLKQSLRVLVEKMRPQDTIGIVTFADSAKVALPPVGVSNKEAILAIIDNLAPGGSTNGDDGLTLAYNIARQHLSAGTLSRVVLATDGDFNVGNTSLQGLLGNIRNQRQSGVSLTTLGFGTGNLKETNLEQLADNGDGNYFYIDNFSEAKKVFESQLTSNIQTIAKDVKLQVEFNPKNVYEYRLIGYENRGLSQQDFHNDAVDAGEVGAGHTVTAVYEVSLNGLTGQPIESRRYAPVPQDLSRGIAPLDAELGYVKIRYKEPTGSQSLELEFPLEQKHVLTTSSNSSDDFRFAAAVAYFGQVLRGNQYTSNVSAAQIAEVARAAIGRDDDGKRQEFLELVRRTGSVNIPYPILE